MIQFGFILLFFLLVRLAVSATNFFSFHFLPLKVSTKNFPQVSVLIPARNEAENIDGLLSDLAGFRYENLEILVYDDCSVDSTASIIKAFAKQNQKIKLLAGVELPKGWLGKNHACYRLAQKAAGDYLLFLDADVRVNDGLMERSLSHLLKYQLSLLSIFPRQKMVSVGEKISVPLMNWILLSLLPLALIRKSENPAFAAANGQFMFFDARVYREIQPHQLFKNHRVEDIAISRHFKNLGLKTDTLLGDSFVECRMYKGLSESVSGFTKNVFQFFGNSISLTVLFAVATTITPFWIFFYLGAVWGIFSVVLVLLIRVFVALASKQPVGMNVLFIVPQHVVFWIIVIKAVINHFRKKMIWKGRNVLENYS